MTRTDLINYLISQRSAKRYLEVCVHNERNNFLNISCEYKITTFPNNSDEFFVRNQEEFDIIFIDGLHTEEQVLKDIRNACRSVAKGGMIVIHDCMPPDAWHQRNIELFREGENWNGTVWKAALRVFNEISFKCTLIDTDWGCGIIDTSQTQIPKKLLLPEKLDYIIHYPWLLKYKQNVASYIREDVKVFYHLACMGNWKDVFNEQMLQLAQNDFRNISMIVLGANNDLDIINSTCKKLDIINNIVFNTCELTHFERPSILAIERYAHQHAGYVLYLHSKGVSNPADETKVKWRRLMMRELVENWEYCMQQLPHFDTIGVNWRDMPPISHFCGNFWYASTKYLRQLADFSRYYDNPYHQITDAINPRRLSCEFWISSGAKKPKILSLYCTNGDFCNPDFWRNR